MVAAVLVSRCAALASFFSLAAQVVFAKADGSRLPERGLLDPICRRIADETSSATKVYYPGSSAYAKAIHHWSFASTETSECVVEPATPEDVGRVLRIVGETRTPFAVKGGGHSTNPGFSSTKGVHISMDAFSDVEYDASAQTAEVGAGLVWDDVYAALEPFAVNVVGGRVSGVGVAGFTLGGGFSWKTNQYGLTVDTVVAFELVKPDGTVSTVTEASDSELFFGLKGGLNNFGIVTKFTLKTFPQTNVWGGLITYTANSIAEVSAATAEFSATVTDPKASIITTYNFLAGSPGISLLLFYDWPTPPPGLFDNFLEIPHLTRNVKTRSFLDLVTAAPSNVQANQRGSFQMVPVLEYTPSFIEAVVNQSVYWGTRLSLLPNLRTGTFFSYAVEPFLPNIYTHNANPTAYPYSRSRFFSPFNIYFSWLSPTDDRLFRQSVLESAQALLDAAQAEGQSNLALAVQVASAKADGSRLPERGLLGLLVDPICARIADETSSATKVYYPGTPQYLKAIHHWSVASTQLSDCVVEPATPEDVGRVLRIVGETRTPFAVKGGGHSTNPGFSSTDGVHISMAAFSEVKYDASAQTAEVGAGLVWDDVYEALEPYQVNVVGGRVSGVGVAGFTLGGGFSWKTNQYGLTVDTVVAFELVKPDGTVSTVTEASDSELFFGLKGGLNNFGIVTKFTLKTFPQTKVWGGVITYTANSIPEVTAATAQFSATVTDPKASIITTYNFLAGSPGITLLLFYDGPTRPSGLFDSFLEIPHFTKDVKTRTFLDLVKAPPSNVQANQRGSFHMVPVLEYTPSFINAVVNQSVYWGKRLSLLPNLRTGTFFSYAVEPFLPNIYTHNANHTAYPYSRSRFFSPFNIYFSWLSPTDDKLFRRSILESAQALLDAQQAEGQSNLGEVPLYPNYAEGSTPVEVIYGSNLNGLRKLKKRVDLDNVMGLAGGFKL
ncbi:hypothetical protein H1R20_g7868, partial [Candolleomyces eurysporus]